MNSRTEGFRKERLAIEAELKAAEEKKMYDSQAPERERVAQQAEHERRELKKRLLMDPFESHDFQAKSYDGRFPDAKAITAAIQSAWDEFNESHDLDQQAKTTLTLFLGLHPDADITLVETWKLALAYLVNRLNPPVEVPPATATEPPTDPVNPYHKHSREADRWDHARYEAEFGAEVFTSKAYTQFYESMTCTGMELSKEAQIAFYKFWTRHPDYQPMTFRNLRRAAITFWGVEAMRPVLTQSECDEINVNRTFESMPADQAVQTLGLRKLDTRNCPPVKNLSVRLSE